MKNNKKKAALILAELKKIYPEVKCELLYEKPHELLIATRLSAQCTDKRVNIVTPALFEKYPDINSFAEASIADVEQLIKSCGLFKTKASDIVEMCGIIKKKFSGMVPENLDDLLTLPGVGRKTANLIVGELYGKPAIVTDTHVIRLSIRLGLVAKSYQKDPKKIEAVLRQLLPAEESLGFCHRLVWFGRRTCTARSPKCNDCVLYEFCVMKP